MREPIEVGVGVDLGKPMEGVCGGGLGGDAVPLLLSGHVERHGGPGVGGDAWPVGGDGGGLDRGRRGHILVISWEGWPVLGEGSQ